MMPKKKESYTDIINRIDDAIEFLGIDNSYLNQGDPIIYHYTKLEHAKKILRGKKLVFTLGSKLVENDKDELPLSCIQVTPDRNELIKLVLSKKGVPFSLTANKVKLLNGSPDFFEDTVLETVALNRSRIGIACFNQTPENDYLWENYAANGAGVCIGFKASAFDRVGAVVSKVKYDDTTYTANFNNHGIEALMIWTLVKKTGFTKEDEIRAICFDPASRCDSRGRVKFDQDAVLEIHTGPNMRELDRIRLKNLLKEEGYINSVRLINR